VKDADTNIGVLDYLFVQPANILGLDMMVMIPHQEEIVEVMRNE
jgi:hypothetical protein